MSVFQAANHILAGMGFVTRHSGNQENVMSVYPELYRTETLGADQPDTESCWYM